ncbi:MAG: Ig-like domain-containing protein [Chloroflexi bacterium]|nr:Ig-like domain-containing protein [Chloroflexota bacterium]
MIKTLVVTALGGVLLWNAAAQNLVVNGDFESPVLPSWVAYSPGSTDLTGWTIDDTPPDGVQQAKAGILGNNGTQTLQLTGGSDYSTGGGILQTITTTPGAYYLVSIDLASRGGGAVTGNFSFVTNHPLSISGTTFTTVSWVVVATDGSTLLDITGDPQSGSQQLLIDNVSVTATAVAGPVDAGTSTVSASPASVPADGATASTITVRLTDASGVPVSGKTVTLANTSGPGTPVITTVSGTTDAAGYAVFTVTCDTAGTYVFTATDVTDGNLVITQTAPVIFSQVVQSLVVNGGFEEPNLGTGWAPYSAGAATLTGWTISGNGLQHFSTSIFGAFGSQNVQMTSDYTAAGTISQTVTTTPGAFYIISLRVASRNGKEINGTASFGDTEHPFSLGGLGVSSGTNVVTFTAAATSGSTTVQVTGGNPRDAEMLLLIDDVNVVEILPGPVDVTVSTVDASQGSVAADGLSTSTISVTLTDSDGIPVAGKTVALAKTSGPGTPVITTISGTTDGGGKAVFSVTSTTPGTIVFTATDVTDGNLIITDTATVNFLAGSVANAGTSTVVASPTSLPANGVATSTITVTLKDATSGPVSGKTVTLAKTAGPGTPVITTVSGTSGVNGQATFTVASTTTGNCVFTATDVTDGNVVITNTATVTFTVGPVSLGTSTVVASPAYVPADNTSVSTVTVTLRDATSNGVPNKTVSLSLTSGPGSPSITPVSGTATDSNGVVAFTVSSITPGADVFTATDVDDGNLALTQTATVTFLSPVSWSGLATTVVDDSDVVTNGILVYAEHWAGFDGAVNGVFFTSAQNHVISSKGGYETLTEANGYPQGSLSTNYWNILRGKWYQAGSGQTVTLNGLQAGHQYLLQIWSSDPRYGPNQEQIILPGFALNIKAGQYGLGTFTAVGPVQILGLAGDGVLNAVQVRDLSIIAVDAGPGAGQLTLRGYTESAGNIVTERATSLATPIVWTPIQTNAVPGGNYSFTVPTAGAAAYYRTKQ